MSSDPTPGAVDPTPGAAGPTPGAADPTSSSADPTGGSSLPAVPAAHDPASHDFDAQKEVHRRIRNDPDYDDWEYGTEPLPHEAWLKRPAADPPAD
jgi:hypothetical protein